MTFGDAFNALKESTLETIPPVDLGMRLPHWQEDVVIKVQKPDEHSKMTAPYLYVEGKFGKVPRYLGMIELFSDKWELVDYSTHFLQHNV